MFDVKYNPEWHPTPKEGVLTVSQADIDAIDALIKYVSDDAFDHVHGSRLEFREKSEAFLGNIQRVGAIVAGLTPDSVISQDDVIAIYVMTTFIGFNVFDVFGDPPGHRGKSLKLQDLERQVDAMLAKLMNPVPPDFEGFFWMDPLPLTDDEAHPKLLDEIGNRDLGMLQVELSYQSEEFRLGSLQLAFDDEAGKVCGLFWFNCKDDDIIAGPTWIEAKADINDVIQTFANGIPVDRFTALMCGEDGPAHEAA
ncbi:hypothetical protein QA646_08740 [Rhizobium sp. CB3090]|uniref:hypothetical protein n=1 Tax=Rhizobium sp. CB3090 TaxID=3039156 RepID=UPI0024B1D674|nr:hypothetical protein [Rhizobium sp. CB3090]WFU10909.1 hypothetical protein QA646_08740 [Rhizobium sp. CB3090]